MVVHQMVGRDWAVAFTLLAHHPNGEQGKTQRQCCDEEHALTHNLTLLFLGVRYALGDLPCIAGLVIIIRKIRPIICLT